MVFNLKFIFRTIWLKTIEEHSYMTPLSCGNSQAYHSKGMTGEGRATTGSFA